MLGFQIKMVRATGEGCVIGIHRRELIHKYIHWIFPKRVLRRVSMGTFSMYLQCYMNRRKEMLKLSD